MTEHVKLAQSLFEARSDHVLFSEHLTGARRTYGQVAEETGRLAAALRSCGLRDGDRICFFGGNSLELAYLFFASWHLGATTVPINPELPSWQARDIVATSAPRLIMGEPGYLNAHQAFLREQQGAEVFAYIPRVRPQQSEKQHGFETFDVWDAASSGMPLAPFGGIRDDRPFLRIYTSGSTAAPKGVDILFHRLFGNERAFCQFLGIDQDHRFFNILPMSYLGGVHNLMLLPFSVGGSVVLSEPLGPANLFGFWDTVREESVTTLWFTGAMLSLLLALRAEEEDWIAGQIKLALVGMAPLSQQTKRAFESRFGTRLYENYALSETAFITSNRAQDDNAPASKGRILPGVSVTIIDSERRPVREGELGELLVKTPYLFDRYINATEEDNAAITEDGFLTGDIGYMSGGELFVVDRRKDLIIRGGLNIAPALVEAALARIEGVVEVAVVGVPHPIYGEEVAAAIVCGNDSGLTADGVVQASQAYLAPFQVPRQIKIMSQLPRGLTGKIDKRAVRAVFHAQ